MHTLTQLQNGDLHGAVSLKLSEGLTHFPREIFQLAATLEVLDLSGNMLTELPADFGRLKKLRILFCSNNPFTVLPAVLGDCPLLDIVGFKACKIDTVPPPSLNPNLRWLILTYNNITELPTSIGKCLRMQKLLLAGNRLSSLPAELGNCLNLSLLRISANRFTGLPPWLLSMPVLSWLAFSGNPFSPPPQTESVPLVHWQQLHIQHILGQGASGIIYRATMQQDGSNADVAVKIFKGALTSDGLPMDEIRTFIAAGTHPALVRLSGRLTGHPEGKEGLVMDLIPAHYHNFGMPPSFETCTRDVFPPHMTLTAPQVLNIARTMASLASHLHSKGIMHGDLYAHNILVDDNANSILSDFGAASCYNKNADTAPLLERIEVSAFGYLLDDLLSICTETSSITTHIASLRNHCLKPDVACRPSFHHLCNMLAALQ